MKEEPKKLNVKKIILIGLGVLAGLIIVYALGLWIFFTVTFKAYSNEKDGIEVSYPKTWEVKEYPAEDVIVSFVAPKENALDTFAENVSFSTYDMSKMPHSTDDYAKIMIDQLLMLFEDLQLVEKSFFPVGGQNGYRMVLKIVGEEAKTIVVYAFTIDTMGYNVLYVGANDRYIKERFLLDAMAMSLRVRY